MLAALGVPAGCAGLVWPGCTSAHPAHATPMVRRCPLEGASARTGGEVEVQGVGCAKCSLPVARWLGGPASFRTFVSHGDCMSWPAGCFCGVPKRVKTSGSHRTCALSNTIHRQCVNPVPRLHLRPGKAGQFHRCLCPGNGYFQNKGNGTRTRMFRCTLGYNSTGLRKHLVDFSAIDCARVPAH